jgi:hypothetical protein
LPIERSGSRNEFIAVVASFRIVAVLNHLRIGIVTAPSGKRPGTRE